MIGIFRPLTSLFPELELWRFALFRKMVVNKFRI